MSARLGFCLLVAVLGGIATCLPVGAHPGPLGVLPAASSAPPSLPAPPADDSARVDSLLRRAKALIEAGTNHLSIDSLRTARGLATQATDGPAHRALAHYYAALADVRIVNQVSDTAEDRREQILTDAVQHLETATEQAPKMADAWALLAGCYGRLIGLHPMRGMALGPKASDALETAKTLAPGNPRVWIVSGTQDYFRPEAFGGDDDRALQSFTKAARLAAQETVADPLMPDWGRAEAHAWIGLAHMKAGRYRRAQTAFETALAQNPDYGWVKTVLLPKLEEKQR